MARLLFSRLISAIFILLAITFLVASLVKLLPGDPVDVLAVGNPGITEADMDRLRDQLGIDRPIFEQFVTYVSGALHGEFGESIRQRVPVADLIVERLPATAELAFWSLLLALVIAIPLGIAAAVKRNSLIDYVASFVAVIGVSIPGFLVGVLLILWFAVTLRWLPSSGYRGSAMVALGEAVRTGNPAIFWDSLRYFILPSVSLALVMIAVNARLTRSSMIEVLGLDYVAFARAKGLPPHTIYLRHALRNAILPVITVAGLQMGSLLSGAVVVETVFAWPGMGRLAVQAVQWRDYPLIQGVIIVSATAFITLNLLLDLFYGMIDPALRRQH